MRTLLVAIAIPVILALGCETTEEKVSPTPTPTAPASDESASTTQNMGEEEGVVARVNGRPVYDWELRRYSLEDAIVNEILYQEGLRLGKDEKFQDKIDQYRKQLVVTSLRKEILDQGIEDMSKEVTPEQIEKYYNENIDKYIHLVLKKISVDDRGVAEDIRARLLKGESFDSIKSDYADSGTKVIVRTTRSTNRFNRHFPIKDAGEVSGIIEDGSRFLILQVERVEIYPLERERNSIRHIILSKRKGNIIRDFAERVKEEQGMEVEIYKEELDQ